MLVCRDVASFSTCSWMSKSSSSIGQMVESGGTVCGGKLSSSSSGLSMSRAGTPRITDARVSPSCGGMSCGFWGLDVELDAAIGRRNGGSRRAVGVVVVRAQRSRFFKKYTRSSQDKIEMLVKTLCTSKESAAEALDQHATWMKPPDWFNVLDGIGRRRRWLLALEVFRWIQVQKWYKVDNGYYSKIISIMGKERQYRMAMSMFKEMKRVGCRPDPSLYNSVLTVFLRGEDKEEGFKKALSLFDEMKLMRRCQPNIVTYNILTRAAAQMGDQDKVNALFKDLFLRDLSPDHFTFNGIMDAYGKAGQIATMEAMLQRMRDEKLKPDLVTFNTLIDAYGRAGEFEKMEQVVWSMTLKRTPPILPAVKTFNSIITNYGNAGLVERFESVLDEMKKVNLSPSYITYEALVGAYGQSGQFDKMRDSVKKMASAGFKPQSSTLNKMLGNYCSQGMTTEAEDLLENSMAEWGVEATSVSYAIVIRAHKKAGRRLQMEALLDKMKTKGIKPTKETYFDVMELIGIELDHESGHHDETAGTARDLDEMSSLRTDKDANQEFLSHAENMIGAAA